MLCSRVTRTLRLAPAITRSLQTSAPVSQQAKQPAAATDPIQALFISKLREYNTKKAALAK